VLQRKNRTLQEMARTMLNESNVKEYFWAEAINTSCYILNRVSIRKVLNKTPYELWKNIKPSISYFHIFGCYCYILNNKEKLGKFDPKSDKAIFLGYSTTSKGYRVYNLKTQTVEISMHVIFDEYDEHSQPKESEDTDVSTLHNVLSQNTVSTVEKEDDQNVQDQTLQSPPRSWRMVGDHPTDQIIGSTTDGVRTRLSFQDNNMAMISQMEPKSINDAIIDDSWVEAMKEEFSQFERNKVWNLVPNNQGKTIIGTRWVFRNKLDEEGKVVRNKARLVAQGYNQQEGIDYDETFAPVASSGLCG